MDGGKEQRDMGVCKNRGKTPKSSILIGFSIINHPFWSKHFQGLCELLVLCSGSWENWFYSWW